MSPVISDRRPAIRMSVDCSVRVRETRHSGQPFRVDARVVRICTTGLYMYVTARMCAGARVFTVVPLPSGARVALRGYVTRLELHGDAHFGVAVRFTRTRLLPAAAQAVRVAVH